MPSVNVRFSDEEHEVLRRAVFDRGRGWSLQKEIIERLFGDGLGREAVVSTAGRGVTDTGPVWESPDAGRSVAPALPAEPAKPCSRKARHHINHGGNPCPECGWPK